MALACRVEEPSTASIADIAPYSITSSARASSVGGTVEAERLGGPEVDRKLVLGRHLHREVGRFLASENAIDVARPPGMPALPLKADFTSRDGVKSRGRPQTSAQTAPG